MALRGPPFQVPIHPQERQIVQIIFDPLRVCVVYPIMTKGNQQTEIPFEA